jgi:HAD superfamily hydrolase (TIGR01509 family)
VPTVGQGRTGVEMPTQVVLFDLGGVLVELGGVDRFGGLIGEADENEIWRVWLTSYWVRRFERGHCTREDFAGGMVVEHDLEVAADDFLEQFLNWPQGLIPGALDLIADLAAHVRPACLSNTNELHWHEQIDAHLVQAMFETRFLSHEIGLVKPDREIFEHVVEGLGCDPGEVLFLDDNQLNVDGARSVGLDAHRVAGVEDSRCVLANHGLLR